ncbi:MAG: xanthine dehydrogenase family protein molybdopterin-binding subunit [Bacteroidetes bacterium]|nr:xanthine dehydrogenase family protein molybdopterin-binding subunit [Bacteroidota bacterium]
MKKINRREFIQLSALASGGLLVIGVAPSEGGEQKIVNLSANGGQSLNQFISIGADNHVILYNHRPEMGQGTFESMPMILAEELEVDINNVEIRPSEANESLYGSQMVVGSRSVQSEFMILRKMGAAARTMLVAAAAQKWSVPETECAAKAGMVVHESGMQVTYGELVEVASKMKAPENPKLKDPKSFTIIGRSTRRQDIPVKTNGKAIFGIDVKVPGMKYACIEHCPVWLGKIGSYDKNAALKVSGVTHVEVTQRTVWGRKVDAVAVLGDNYWSAMQGKKALNIQWDANGLDGISSATIMSQFREEAKKPGEILHSVGDAESVFQKGGTLVEASYELPYQAHVPMEPMNVVVNMTENAAEFWGSTQHPNGVRTFLSTKYGIPRENVRINYTFMGGGFGRRSMTDVVEEAADLSLKVNAPVKLIWPREEDQTQGPFRNCSLNVCRAVLNGDGSIEALEHKIVTQEINNQTGDNNKAGRQIMGGVTTEYQIPNMTVRGVLQKLHIPISYWRAVYHSTNPFAHESFIDELSVKAGKDPLEFRMSMMQNHERYNRLLNETMRITNWKSGKKPGTGRGVALVERSGAHFVMVVEVQKKEGMIRPVKVTTVIDVGTCVNPDTVKAQVEGSVIMGLGAVYAGLTVNNGRITEQNFDRYPILKFNQCPEIETHILESTGAPDGAGEAGLPTIAPAFANAIFDLTGRRIRRLPMTQEDLKA